MGNRTSAVFHKAARRVPSHASHVATSTGGNPSLIETGRHLESMASQKRRVATHSHVREILGACTSTSTGTCFTKRRKRPKNLLRFLAAKHVFTKKTQPAEWLFLPGLLYKKSAAKWLDYLTCCTRRVCVAVCNYEDDFPRLCAHEPLKGIAHFACAEPSFLRLITIPDHWTMEIYHVGNKSDKANIVRNVVDKDDKQHNYRQ